MSIEESKLLAQRFCASLNAVLDGRDLTALTERDLAVFDEFMTPDLARDTRENLVPEAHNAWGDHHIEITDMVAEDDKVWLRVATSGGHIGEFRGMAPTGKRWTNTGVLFMRVENGRLAEWSGQFDELNHATQLGATLMPPTV
jgi:predicted ester cyclase